MRGTTLKRLLLPLLWVLFLVVEVVALRAASGMLFSDDLESRFRGDFPAYVRYEALLEEYGRFDTDIIALFEADSFADGESHVVMEDFLLDVQFLPHIEAVLSPFSFTVAGADGSPQQLFAPDLSPEDLTERLHAARAAQGGLSRVLSEDLGAAQVLVVIPDMPTETGARADLLAQMRALAAEVSDGTGVTVTLTGYPVIRASVTQRLDADTALLNSLGVVAGLAVALIALRSVALALVIAFTAHTARLWSITALLPLGYDINAVTITLPTLILVMSFSEAIHLGIATRRAYADGQPRPLRRAVASVWPAALLASVVTAGAFAALLLSSSALVSGLAVFGVLAIVISTPLIFAVFALQVVTLDRLVGFQRFVRQPTPTPTPSGARGPALLAAVVQRGKGAITLVGLGLVALSTAGYLMLQPNYGLFEGLRDGDPEIEALHRIEVQFGPLTSLEFEHPVSADVDLAAVARTLGEVSGWGDAFALPAPRDAARALGDGLPQVLRNRLVSDDGTRTLISLPYAYDGSALARRDITALEARIAQEPALADLGPATGVVHVSSFASERILNAFSLCFALAAAASGVLIAIWLRSPLLGLVSMLPNILPITAVGAWMWLAGQPFSFTSGIALTIAFGIAVDDTVHLLNRARQEARADGAWSEASILRALRGIAPTLVLTSAVLIGGLIGTLFSSLPSLVDFGILTIAVFVLALLADLLLLPALLLVSLPYVNRHP
ncbi:MMPL family transporter [Rhodobacteraceae bacterium N5(2021)]|uniref:MMPL family transporter n=1 Tax=Gymnodinialimonas phycosphaerae TaxID=2841589 RepID=A0A975YHE6_9RHOB|nr:MMPL family transporter [Gymnodinialimonas phycosphaerae]MBY4892724.1 MMPL family transporter [Gymnodinialimonas phycosphaerae]